MLKFDYYWNGKTVGIVQIYFGIDLKNAFDIC